MYGFISNTQRKTYLFQYLEICKCLVVALSFCLLVKLRLFSLSLAYSPHICLPLLIFIFCPAVVLCLCRLALYVYEYLLHVGAQKSAQTFLSEVSHENALCVCAGLQAMYFMCPL